MEFSRLRTLRELSTRGTMAAVADALFLTPSAVSQQISLLEQETGVQLVERQGRGVRLTHAGEVLIAHADRLFAIIDEARSDMAAIKEEVAGTLRVAVFPTAGTSLLPAAIHLVEEQYPYLRVVLEEMEPADGLAAVESWRCDLAFIDDLIPLPESDRKAIEKVPLIEDTLYALLPREHRLAERASLSLKELKDERWALDSAWSSFADFVRGLCRQAGYEPDVNAYCRGFEILAAMVSEGCSVSVVAGLRLRYPVKGVKAVKLKPEVKRQISVAYRKSQREHPAISVFINALTHSVDQAAKTPKSGLI